MKTITISMDVSGYVLGNGQPLVTLEALGRTIDELLDDAEFSVDVGQGDHTNWHPMGELPADLYAMFEKVLIEEFNRAAGE